MNIDRERLRELLKSEAKLSRLEAGGIDNWEGYSEALYPYYSGEDATGLDDEYNKIDQMIEDGTAR